MKPLDYKRVSKQPNDEWRRVVFVTAVFNVGCVVAASSIIVADALLGVRFGIGPGLFVAFLALFGISYFGLLAEIAFAATDGRLAKLHWWIYLWVVTVGIVGFWFAVRFLRFMLT